MWSLTEKFDTGDLGPASIFTGYVIPPVRTSFLFGNHKRDVVTLALNTRRLSGNSDRANSMWKMYQNGTCTIEIAGPVSIDTISRNGRDRATGHTEHLTLSPVTKVDINCYRPVEKACLRQGLGLGI